MSQSPYTEGPCLTRILGLEKTPLRKICVSETVGGPLLTQKFLNLRLHQPKIAVIGSAVVKTV